MSDFASDQVVPEVLAAGPGAMAFHSIIDALPQIFWITPPEGGASYCNARFYEYTGLTFDRLRGDGWSEVVHPDDLPQCVVTRQESLEKGNTWEYEYRLRRHDGAYCWFLARAEPVRDSKTGAIVRWVGTATDITHHKETERALRESEERLSLSLAAAQIGTWELDFIHDQAYLSERVCEILALPPEQTVISLEELLSRIYPDDRERVMAAGAAAWRGEAAYDVEHRVLREDGEVRWIAAKAAVLWEDGAGPPLPSRLIGIQMDITERRRREERERLLAALTERTAALLDPDAVAREAVSTVGECLQVSRCTFVEVDPDGTPRTVREDWSRAEEEATTRTGADGLVRAMGEPILEVLRAGRPFACPDVLGDKRIAEEHRAAYVSFDTRSLVSVPIIRGGRWVGILSVYVAEPRVWRQDEVELLELVGSRVWLKVENARLYRRAKEDEARFRALVLASNQMVWRTGTDGKIEDMPEWRAFTGQSREQVRGYGWLDAVHEEDRPRVEEAWRSAFAARSAYECEYRVRGKDGAYRWFLARGVPVLGADETLREYIGTWGDIDARKRAEEERAAHAEKNARIAETLQRSLLLTPPDGVFDEMDVGTHYEAAWDEALIGGDFFDAFALDGDRVALDGDRVALVAGDCTGKGLGAARYVAEAQFVLRAALREDPDPAGALARLNRIILEGQRLDRRSGGALCGVAVAVASTATGEVLVSAGGAEPPLVVRAATGHTEEVAVTGPVLGADLASEYTTVGIYLAPGDFMVLATDGLTEARNRETRRFFGYDGFVRAVEEAVGAVAGPSPTTPPVPGGASLPLLDGIAREVVAKAKAFAGGRLSDDVCVLVARRRAWRLAGRKGGAVSSSPSVSAG